MEPKTPKQPATKEEREALDLKLLSDAVTELNVSRRAVGLYPPNHPTIRASIQRAFKLVAKLLESRPSIKLGIAKDQIMLDNETLETENLAFREFAETLHQRGIASITFTSGIASEELVSLHELMTMEDPPEGAAFMELSDKKGLRHVRFQPIDLSAFKFVEGKTSSEGDEEGEDGAPGAKGKGRKRKRTIWADYVHGLFDGNLDTEGVHVLTQAPPEALAEMVNESMPESASQEVYDMVINGYIRRGARRTMSSENFGRLLTFIENLNPAQQAKFLSRTKEQIALSTDEAESMMSEMTEGKFQKMVELFSRESSSANEVLRSMIDKITNLAQSGEFPFDLASGDAAVVHDIELGEGTIALFESGKYNDFVSGDYLSMMTKMLSAPASGYLEDVKKMIPECSDEAVDGRTSAIMLELLSSGSLNPQESLGMLTRVTEFGGMFAETGRYDDLLNIIEALEANVKDGVCVNECGSSLQYYFMADAFIEKIIESFRHMAGRRLDSAQRLARAISKNMSGPLMKALDNEAEPAVRRAFLEILGAMGGDVVKAASARLKEDNPHTLKDMMALIRAAGAKEYAPEIRKFIKHKDIKVRIDALRTLLVFRAPDSLTILRHYMADSDSDLRADAIKIAGMYKVRDVVPDLMAIVEKKDIFGSESPDKLLAIKALGEIGDPRAVKSLLNVFTAKAILYKGSLDDMKIEIFRNLGKYPPLALKPLMELGVKSDNPEIRRLCGLYASGLRAKAAQTKPEAKDGG